MSDSPPPQAVLSIDPGRAKCGIAVVDSAGVVHHRAIVALDALVPALRESMSRFRIVALLLGDGTAGKAAMSLIQGLAPDIPLHRVDERYTSELARRRYVEDHPPTGLARLVPRGLRSPDAPYDDYVAVILAERWWKEQGLGRRV